MQYRLGSKREIIRLKLSIVKVKLDVPAENAVIETTTWSLSRSNIVMFL